MKKYRSPYDIPLEAESHAEGLFVDALRTALEVLRLSLLPATGLTALGFVLSLLNQHDWILHTEHLAVNGLAGLSIGCTRIFLRCDSQEREIELR